MMTHLEKLEKLKRFESAMTIFKHIVTSSKFDAMKQDYTGSLTISIDTLDEDLREAFEIFLTHKVEFEAMLRSYNFSVRTATETSITVTDNVLVQEHIPFF